MPPSLPDPSITERTPSQMLAQIIFRMTVKLREVQQTIYVVSIETTRTRSPQCTNPHLLDTITGTPPRPVRSFFEAYTEIMASPPPLTGLSSEEYMEVTASSQGVLLPLQHESRHTDDLPAGTPKQKHVILVGESPQAPTYSPWVEVQEPAITVIDIEPAADTHPSGQFNAVSAEGIQDCISLLTDSPSTLAIDDTIVGDDTVAQDSPKYSDDDTMVQGSPYYSDDETMVQESLQPEAPDPHEPASAEQAPRGPTVRDLAQDIASDHSSGYMSESTGEDTDEEKEREAREHEKKVRTREWMRFFQTAEHDEQAIAIAKNALKKQRYACENDEENCRGVAFWTEADLSTDKQMSSYMLELSLLTQNVYIGATVDVRRRWIGWIGGPRGSCVGHRAHWHHMLVIGTRVAGQGPVTEKAMIQFMMSSCQKHKVWNKRADARGLPRHGTTFIYMCYGRIGLDDDELLVEMIE
jgi:hypothetical protein